MKQLNEHHSFTGMQRDMSIAKHPSSFLYDAHNIRLTARGEDTLLTLTNERGPLNTRIEVEGTYLGHCLLGKYLVVFSTRGLKEDDNASEEDKAVDDYITRIDLSTKEKLVLYNGNLQFSTSNLIEAISSFENENVQKVYWTDGKNQPRVINIVGEIKENVNTQFDFIRELALQEEVTIQKQLGASGSFAPGVIQYAFTYYNKFGQETNIFYTSPLLYVSHKDRGASPEDKVENAFKITIANIDKSFDYLRIYSIQRTSLNAVPTVKRVQDISTILDNTVIQQENDVATGDISPSLEGTAYTPSVSSFTHDFIDAAQQMTWNGYTKRDCPNLLIKAVINGVINYITWGNNSTDDSTIWISTDKATTVWVDYGYHIIQTTSTSVYTLENISVSPTEFNAISFLDTGISGEAIDPTELLYKGGESLIVQTIEQKDNTLFLGNIETQRKLINSTTKASIKSEASRVTSSDVNSEVRVFYPTVVSKGDYLYHNQLTSYADSAKTISVPCGGFKRGDYYRCGVQFQYKDGRWSDPIFLNDEQVLAKPSLNTTNDTISVPVIKYKIGNTNDILNTLYSAGYRKLRPVVVFPSLQDRVTVLQGVTTPTLFFSRDYIPESGVLTKAQSSWFFRPKVTDNAYTKYNEIVSPVDSGFLTYEDYGTSKEIPLGPDTLVGYATSTNPSMFRTVEIQGDFDTEDKVRISSRLLSLHSPDIEFDDSLYNLNFSDIQLRKVGGIEFSATFSDINIQTETPQVSNTSSGFFHKSFIEEDSYGIVAGLFYEDYAIDDADGKLMQWENQHSPFKWLVYPWQRNGSLNNDVTRPQDKGTATSVLKKKVISNLRYSNSILDNSDSWTYYNTDSNPQIYSSDQPTVIKVNDIVYQGNIDTSLYPTRADGMYFAFNNHSAEAAEGNPSFNIDFDEVANNSAGTSIPHTTIWRTFNVGGDSSNRQGLWSYVGPITETTTTKYFWYHYNSDIGNNYLQLAINKQPVRMRYKSTPHLVCDLGTTNPISYSTGLPILEVVRKGDNNASLYRATMFGGTSEDALKANQWIPCGEPVIIPPSLSTSSYIQFEYSYGDTYFQRWDCLKTYPFSFDDINQIVEIGSFMLETRVNIDGRYDRNRGQISNLNMSPINFNLFNPVYNQTDNFFTYRILDESYYRINQFPNQITWTKEKKAGADVDLWTNITLASTYDMDGSKGEIRSLQTWKDQIFCFQDLGISNILFNSRVQIPTSDGVPIEITNSSKVDGYRYISDGIGCKDKLTISNTPSGMYFADTKTNHLYHIADGMQDITTIHNMSSWFNDAQNNKVIKTLHDDVNHDLYVLTDNEALCYSEVLGNFTSFMSYQGISLIESYENSVYTMKDGKLYSMFTGEYNKFFGENPEPWDFTFISNGIDDNLMDFDKIYSTIDYRMDMSDSTDYKHDNSLDIIRVYNEYQDTGEVDLQRVGATRFIYHKDSNLQKKFRIWRIQIPRDNKNGKSLNRIRNPWCKIKLGSKGNDNLKAILYDLNVQYYL